MLRRGGSACHARWRSSDSDPCVPSQEYAAGPRYFKGSIGVAYGLCCRSIFWSGLDLVLRSSRCSVRILLGISNGQRQERSRVFPVARRPLALSPSDIVLAEYFLFSWRDNSYCRRARHCVNRIPAPRTRAYKSTNIAFCLEERHKNS
jgi:hypothetical protein